MRLDYLCELDLVYREFTVLAPFGGSEGTGYGEGGGEFRGERLSGQARWSNHPRKRSDGVFLPDAHGVIETTDGATIIFHIIGRAKAGTESGALTQAMFFETDADSYRWLNDEVCIASGAIDRARGAITAQVFVCVNELES